MAAETIDEVADDIAEGEPFAPFARWFEQAMKSEPLAETMMLATATRDGMPSVRAVLLKGADASGFVFYTNLESRKAEELAANPRAALCFHWKSLGRQIRIEGSVGPASAAEADAYFATRPRDSQIGAWASAQSRPLDSRAALKARFA
jgi:pyridoxamine 5'-phosphate oxidase